MSFIKKIVIVGGGSAGWMTAAALQKEFKDIDLTLIESEELGTIGVGESVIPEVNSYFKFLGIDTHKNEKEFLNATDGVYKLANCFNGFLEEGHRSYYPFGEESSLDYTYNFLDVANDSHNVMSIDDFQYVDGLSAHCCDLNRYDQSLEHSYQVDAIKLAKYLRDKFCTNLTHIVDTVTYIEKDDSGIKQLVLSNSTIVTADLFIDCTGFSSLLINELGVEYEELGMLNDRAVVAQTPYKDEADKESQMVLYTEAKAMSAGWKWKIPLWSRMGNGYVYSSQFISDEDAEKEFREEIEWDGPVNFIKFKSGLHRQPWYKNVITIGLASGFIEPLEATGLHLITEPILRFCDVLKRKQMYINTMDKEFYNVGYRNLVKSWHTLVHLHYALSHRDDTPYWNYITNVRPEHTDTISQIYKIFTGRVELSRPLKYVLFGMKYNPIELGKHNYTKGYNLQHFLDKEMEYKQKATSFVTHYEYLKTHIYS